MAQTTEDNLETRVDKITDDTTDKGSTLLADFDKLSIYDDIKSDAPEGYVYQSELDAIKDVEIVNREGNTVSLKSYLYSGLTVLDKKIAESKDEKLYGGKYTYQEVMNNMELMRIYLPKEYESELFTIGLYANYNRPTNYNPNGWLNRMKRRR